MSGPIERVTLLKASSPESLKRIESLYANLSKTQSKNGHPYILSIAAGPVISDPRNLNHDYSFCVKMTFASLEDMKFYDDECPAHQTIKVTAKEEKLIAGEKPLLMAYFTKTVGDGV